MWLNPVQPMGSTSMNPPKKKKKGPERFSKTAADIEEAVSELLGTN